jgi:hypothetical protein
MPLGQQALCRQHRGTLLSLGQGGPGGAMHFGIGPVEEQAEGVRHLPGDARLRPRGHDCQRENDERQDAVQGTPSGAGDGSRNAIRHSIPLLPRRS